MSTSVTGGITATGFVTPAIQDVLNAINGAEQAAIDPALDVSSDQPLGQINGIMANEIGNLWAALQAVYECIDPNSAEGSALDNVSALTGTVRPAATFTVVSCTVTTNAAATIPAGSLASVAGHTDQVFALSSSVTTTAAASVAATFTCLQSGPIIVQPGTLTNIVTPISGWTAVTNPLLGTTGQNADSDTQLRVLRQQEISQSGSCAVDALRARLLTVPGVLSAQVYLNDSDSAVIVATSNTTTTTITRSPHSFEAVVWDGPSPAASNSAIAATIWANQPSGILSMGTASATTTDAIGGTQTIRFSRATGERLYVIATVTPASVGYAGDPAVAAAISGFISSTQIAPGTEVYALAMKVSVMTLAGVLDVPSLVFDFHATPTNTANLTMAYDAVATLSTSDITVLHG